MGFRCGITGLPNVGKSTLFNALTMARAEARNYPFCTIDPNTGVTSVPDPRLAQIAAIAGTRDADRIIPAAVEFVDIAGLVAGASRGEGLGNRFLASIRETDAIAHVVRCFGGDSVVHVSGQVNPLADIELIDTELALADLHTLERVVERASRRASAGDRDARFEAELAARIRDVIAHGRMPRTLVFSEQERKVMHHWHLLTAKPVLYVANVSDGDPQGSERCAQVRALAEAQGAQAVDICAQLEAELAELEADERAEFMVGLGIDEPGLHRFIRAGYRLLGLHTFFTAGERETRAWTLPVGADAVTAAGFIHTDFARGFICVEVISHADYVRCNGEQGAREAGKLRQEGKQYVIHDGDVCHFRFNV